MLCRVMLSSSDLMGQKWVWVILSLFHFIRNKDVTTKGVSS